ncbi:hypothetical protein B7P43_G10279, partial [Cryptotermes secundus]
MASSFTTSSYSVSTKRKAFTEELSSVLTRRSVVTTEEEHHVSLFGNSEDVLQIEEVSDVFVAAQNFPADDVDAISLKKGDVVEVLDTGPEPVKRLRLDPDLDLGAEVAALLDSSAARHKLAIRPRRKHADSRQVQQEATRWLVRMYDDPSRQGWVPASLLERSREEEVTEPADPIGPEVHGQRREAVVRELVETEEEFGRDLQLVVERYLKPLDSSTVPRVVRDNKDLIFSNLKQIADFHNTVLIEGVKYYASEPRMLGRTFLRLERDFDKHVAYCRDEPIAQEFLQENDAVRDYFEEHSQQLGDDKSLSEHLKLPIQRINDYQLLLKELVKYSSRLGEDTSDLQKALELMLGVPHRANDIKFISSIEGYHGNIHKLGRLLRHDWFTVSDRDGKCKERYLFLFKARILICKVHHIADDRSVFVLKDIIRLPEVEVNDLKDNPYTFELHHIVAGFGRYPITIRAHSDTVKPAWLKEIRQYASDLFALAEHDADDLRLQTPLGNNEDKSEPTTPPPQEPSKVQPPLKSAENCCETQEVSRELVKTVNGLDPVQEPERAIEAVRKVPEQKAEPEIEVPKENIEPGLKTAEVNGFESDTAMAHFQSVTSVKEFSSEEVYMESSGTVMSSSASKSVRFESSSVQSASEETGGVSNVFKLTRSTSADGRPVFTKTIEGSNLEPGQNAVFQCELTSDTPTSMTWLKDNRPMEDRLADRVLISSQNDNTAFRLEVQHCLESDSGVYTARATNAVGAATCTAQLVVQELSEEEKKRRAEANAPLFVVKLKDTELLENTYLRFMIKVKGQPNPTLKFFKEGKEISPNNERIQIVTEKADKGFYELVIADVLPEDAGKYSCAATNKYGEVSCEATVTVTSEKEIFKGLGSTLLEPGEEAQFQWLRDGQPFDPEERFKVLFKDDEDSLALVFQHVKPEDAGLYTCVASTSTGRISCSAELTVQGSVNQLAREPEVPKISTESKSTEVGLGGSAMLELKVEGYPKPDIKWTKDGNPVEAGGRVRFLYEDEESMSLIIKGVTADDAGKYKVVAKNELGQDSTEMDLLVKAPPKIKTELENSSCMTDQNMTFTVEVEGMPVPEVKWLKEGQQISQSDRIKIVKEKETHSLTIEKARLEDTGSYSIVAVNEISQTSSFWQFVVHSPPVILKNLNKKVEAKEDDTLCFDIKVQGDPKPEVKWTKDGEDLTADGKHITISEDGQLHSLIIKNASRDDSGTIAAQVWNDHGWLKDTSEVNVRCAPEFKRNLKDFTANEGDTNVEFNINVEAYPKPAVKWFLNDIEITEKKTEFTREEDENNYKLIIKKVTTDLAGKYECKVINDLGTIDTACNFTVQYKPHFPKGLTNIEVDEGQELTLSIQCSAVPEPTIKWFKDGQEVTADAHIKISRDSQSLENYYLTVTLVKGADAGDYEAKAENSMGTATTKNTVKVNTVPQIVGTDMDDREIYESLCTAYEVRANGIPRPEAKWYHDGAEITPSDRVKLSDSGESYKLELKDAQLSDSGTYKCKIANRLGEKTHEAKLSLISVNEFRKPKITQPLSSVSVPKNEPAVLALVLTADPLADVKWFHDDVELTEDEFHKFTLETKDVDDGLKECTYTLTIPSGRHKDTGQYRFTAKNKFGKDECSARLDILLMPEIDGLKDSQRIPYEDIEFEVLILANPKPQVVW